VKLKEGRKREREREGARPGVARRVKTGPSKGRRKPNQAMDSQHWISRLAAAKRFYAAQLGQVDGEAAVPAPLSSLCVAQRRFLGTDLLCVLVGIGRRYAGDGDGGRRRHGDGAGPGAGGAGVAGGCLPLLLRRPRRRVPLRPPRGGSPLRAPSRGESPRRLAIS
jgi:hypothetical protein